MSLYMSVHQIDSFKPHNRFILLSHVCDFGDYKKDDYVFCCKNLMELTHIRDVVLKVDNGFVMEVDLCNFG